MSPTPEDSTLPESCLKKREVTENGPLDMGAEATKLMLATKAGDGAAFDSLVSSLRGRAFFVAQSLVGSREDAFDLSQEAFMKVYRARETFRDGDPFLPWFHRILRNTCFSFLRQHGRLRKVSLSSSRAGAEDEGDWELIDAKAEDPSDRLVAAESNSEFQAALDELSARDREIMTLRHYRELSYKEIADSLGIPQGTVMSRLFHARRRLRERLADTLHGMPEATGSELEALGGE